jgi:hypothetical protein
VVSDAFLEETDEAREIINQMNEGRELAVRIKGEISSATIIFSLAGVSKAIAPLLDACPAKAAPPKALGQ